MLTGVAAVRDEDFVLWAKVGHARYQDGYHPLLCHLIDAGTAAELLWDKFLPPASRAYLSRALRLTEADTRRWIAFLAALHDIGKGSPVFQQKVPDSVRMLEDGGFDFPAFAVPTDHGTIGARILVDSLRVVGVGDRAARTFSEIVGGHHGVLPTSLRVDDVGPSTRGTGCWQDSRQRMTGAVAELFGISGRAAAAEPAFAAATFLAGLVSVADWIASDPEWFPYAGAPGRRIDLETYLCRARASAARASGALGWAWPSEPLDHPVSFEELFGFAPRPVQRLVGEVGQSITSPSLFLIEVPTGEGKTEAAFYLADQWMKRLGQRGAYVGLPTQATSNQMFLRVRDFLEQRYHDSAVNLQLMHGHASLSADFELLLSEGRNVFCPDRIYEDDAAEPPGGVAAAEWFVQRKRGLLAHFGVGTIDQALLAALVTRHVFVRLLGLAGRTVVIDEVHAYDAYMSTLIDRLLEWLAALGSPVVMLSATLTRQRHSAFRAAYARGLGVQPPGEPPPPYPRVTWLGETVTGGDSVDVAPEQRRELRFTWRDGSLEALGRALRDALAEGGSAAIVCNTVADAQRAYLALEPFFPAVAADGHAELDLLHARMPFSDRQNRESRLLARYGKPDGSRRPHRSILVSTQVIEQSLDLDFDLLITELAPVDLVLQRAGRLHRHPRPRPAGLTQPVLWLLDIAEEDGLPVFGRSRYVYDEHVLLRSWFTLRSRASIRVPEDVESLIESVYGETASPFEKGTPLWDIWERTLAKHRREIQIQEHEATWRRVPPPGFVGPVSRLTEEFREEDSPELHTAHQALTRLGERTVQAIALHGTPEHAWLDAGDRQEAVLDRLPTREETRELLRHSLPIAHGGVVSALLEKAVPSGWRRSPLLCHARPIYLDSSGSGELAKYRLTLDAKLGLVIR